MHRGMEQSSRLASREDIAEGLGQAAILVVRHMSDRAALNLTASMVLDTLNWEGTGPGNDAGRGGGHRPAVVTWVDDPDDGRAALVTITDPGAAPHEQHSRSR